MLEKLWAEYLTMGVTAAFLPWEMYEIVRELRRDPGGAVCDQPGGAGVPDLVSETEGAARVGVTSGRPAGRTRGLFQGG